MQRKLIIVADLGLLRAYREIPGAAGRQPHLELVDELISGAAHEKLSDQVTDQAGRFPRGSGAAGVRGSLSSGEQLHQEAEQNDRLIDLLARKINGLLLDGQVTCCDLAASAPIHKQLLEALDPNARAKIGQVLASNLAKTDPGELRRHFENQPT